MKKYAPLFLSLYYGFRICCLLLFTGLSLICFAGWTIPVSILILFCLLFSLIATLSDDRYFTNIPYKIRRFLYPIILIIIISVLVFRSYGNMNFFDYIQTVFTWLINNLNNKVAYSMEYALFVLFLLYVLLSLLIKFCEKYFKMQLCLTLLIILCIFLLGAANINMSPLALFGGFFYLLDTCMTYCLRILTKSKEVSTYCASLSTVIIIMLGFILIIPYSDAPIPYYRIMNAFDKVRYELSVFGQDFISGFSSNLTGISDGTIKLSGGNVEESDTIILKYYKKTLNYNPIYLTSSIADYYSGNSWENQIDTVGEKSEYLLNIEEKISNLKAAGLMKTDPVFHQFSMKITYRYIYTKNILYPENCFSMLDFNPSNTIVDKGINIRFKRKPKLDTSYNVSTTEINMKDNKVLEFINSCPSFMEYANDNPSLYEKFAPYLQLPESLPKRVHDLAEEITADCTTDYEKADYIRQYVQKYPYSTDVPQFPDDRDAVDYFLFEQREGYCIYYASAVAVLCRSVGIPSRYIQGVALGKGKDAYNWISVPSSSSHAWCEVYINGFGWVRMDATPIEQITGYHSWPIVTDQKLEEGTGNLPPMPYHPDEEEKPTEIDWQALREKREQRRILTLYALLAAMILIGILVILIIINIISKEHKKKLFKNSSFNEQAVICLQDILTHLAYFGITKKPVETMLEFTNRLNQEEPDMYLDTIKILMNYNNKRYSLEGFNEKDIEGLQRAIMLLQSRFIDRNGKLQYFLKSNLRI